MSGKTAIIIQSVLVVIMIPVLITLYSLESSWWSRLTSADEIEALMIFSIVILAAIGFTGGVHFHSRNSKPNGPTKVFSLNKNK